MILPFWSNFLIRIYAWMIILGPQAALARGVNGVLAWFGHEPVPLLFSSFAVLVCLVYVHLPFMVLPLYANLEKHDQSLLDAAQDLGANRWQRFWRITFPLSLPGVYAGAALVFIPALGIFAIPDILGGPGRQPDRQRDQAAVPRNPRLAVRQRAVDRAYRSPHSSSRASPRGSAGATSARRRASGIAVRKRPFGLWLAAGAGYAFLYVPLIIVVVYSFNDSRLNAEWVGFTLGWYDKLFHDEDMLRRRRQLARDRARREPRYRRCWARWPAWRCTATDCGSCRCWC